MQSLVTLFAVVLIFSATLWLSSATSFSKSKLYYSTENQLRLTQEARASSGAPSSALDTSLVDQIASGAATRHLLRKQDKELFKAVEAGDSSLVESLLADGEVDIEVVNRRGFTPLILAALNGDLVLVRLLIDFKAQIDAQTNAGYTALHVAAARGHLDVLQYLIKHGANLRLKAKRGETPLLFATLYGQRPSVHFLLQNGATLNSTTNAGFNVLHLAALYGHLSIVEYLVSETGVDLDTRQNKTGATALFLAAEKGFPEVVKILLTSGADLNQTTVQDVSPLFVASQQGHVSVVELLINNGANLATQESVQGATALIIAVCNAHERIVRRLINAGANLEARTKFGNTAVMCAVHLGHLYMLRLLQKSGARLQTHNRRGRCAIHLAVIQGHLNVVQFLLRHNAQIESKDHSGHTALHLSVLSNQTRSLELLLQRGAQVEARTRRGETALHLASRSGLVVVVQILLKFNADIETRSGERTMTPLMFAAYYNHAEVVLILIEYGASTLARTNAKATVLHLAVTKEIDLVILKTLTARRSGLGARDQDGDTPLAYASIHGNFNAVKFLIRKGSDQRMVNNKDQTAEDLICACLKFSKKFVQCIGDTCSTEASRKKLRKLFQY
eukprot:g5415.t1